MIGVVIPSAGQSGTLRDAVASVADVPVIVVDDSKDGDVVNSHATVLRSSGGEGFASAANIGLAEMERRGISLVLLLNDDAVMAQGALQRLLEEWSDGVGALSPVIEEPEGPVYGIIVSPLGRVRLARKPVSIQALSGASLMVRSTERFDTAYVHGFEDIDLCRRLRDRNLRIGCVLDAHCTHRAGQTVSRRSRWAQRHAVGGHLRFVGGGFRGVLAVGLAMFQVMREFGPPERFLGIVDGVWDHLKGPPPPHL